jgi:predicted Fe-Mo cluster-binding NifX family protein
MKKEIKEIKQSKNNIIEINNALKADKNSSIFVCGVLAKFLINEGIDVLIAKNIS